MKVHKDLKASPGLGGAFFWIRASYNCMDQVTPLTWEAIPYFFTATYGLPLAPYRT